nr:hypothetical protein [Tanacetum cinerariifolium]
MANVPPYDPNIDAPAIVPAPVNPDHAPAQPVGLGNGFARHWIGDNIPNNQNGWIEEDAEEKEEDPEEDPKKDSEEEPEDYDDDMEMDHEAEVIDPYMDDGSNNPPPPNSKEEETHPTSPVIPDVDGQPIPPIALFGQNFDFDESSSTANLLTRNSKIFLTGPMCLNLGRLGKVSNVMSDFSGLKKLVKGLSDRFDEYERSKDFDANKVLEKELVNERNGKEFYREFGEYMCRMLQNRQKSEGSFPLPLSSDAAIADAAIATSGIDDDDDDTAHMDSHPHEPRRSPCDTQTMPPRKSTRGNPPPSLTQDTVNRMIQESVEAAIRAEREREREREFKMKQIMLKDLTLLQLLGNVATLGIEAVTRKMWAEIKVIMTEEFCPPEEIQRMEGELWNLRVKEMNISSYTTRFNELLILCPGMVPMERKKVEAYIRGLLENIKGKVTSSEPATLNKVVRMAHTLMEQKVKAIAEREADNKKRKWENF